MIVLSFSPLMTCDIPLSNYLPDTKSLHKSPIFYGWYRIKFLEINGPILCSSTGSSANGSLSSNCLICLVSTDTPFGIGTLIPSVHLYYLCSKSHLRPICLISLFFSKLFSIWCGNRSFTSSLLVLRTLSPVSFLRWAARKAAPNPVSTQLVEQESSCISLLWNTSAGLTYCAFWDSDSTNILCELQFLAGNLLSRPQTAE